MWRPGKENRSDKNSTPLVLLQKCCVTQSESCCLFPIYKARAVNEPFQTVRRYLTKSVLDYSRWLPLLMISVCGFISFTKLSTYTNKNDKSRLKTEQQRQGGVNQSQIVQPHAGLRRALIRHYITTPVWPIILSFTTGSLPDQPLLPSGEAVGDQCFSYHIFPNKLLFKATLSQPVILCRNLFPCEYFSRHL